MLVAVIAGVFVFSMVNPVSLALQRDRATAAAFVEVRNAPIGWSAARTESACPPCARPGELPCPDMNNDGLADNTCVAGAIGRVPWKTLGIPEPKDAAGETLWYAIAGPFRNWGDNNDPIHSDTKGNITVYRDSTASAVTTEAIAVLFAPGASLGTQNRDAATAPCTTTGTTIARNLCAANYLETVATVNNSTTNGPFISAQSSDTFNDRVMAITTSDLIPIVEQRVAREVRALLVSYKAAVGAYPWADCTNGTSDVTPSPDPTIDGASRGRIPWQTAYPVNWGSGGAPILPFWFTNQGATSYNWAWVIYYSVGKNYLEASGARCSTDPNWGCEPGQTNLSVDGVWGKEVVIVMPGPAGASRPGVPYVGDVVGSWGTANWGIGTCDATYWQAYLEDSENNDVLNDRYVTPNPTFYTHDRLYTIP